MNIKYVKVFRFISWLFGEIVRLGKKGTVPEIHALSETLQKAKRDYINARRRIKYQPKEKNGKAKNRLDP